MSEISKLYENAGIKSFKTCEFCTQKSVDCLKENISNKTCGLSSDIYPPFTAEKQLELIKYFSNNYNIGINKDNNIFRLLFLDKDGIHNFYTSGVGFAEQLALFVISRYKNEILTEEERKQIKEILE